MHKKNICTSLLALACVSVFAFYAPAFAQSADDQSASSDDVATDVVDVPVDDADQVVETTAVDDVVEPVPVEWVQRDGEPEVMMYSMMGMGGIDDQADRAAEQAATQAMDQIDSTSSEAPLP